MKNLQRIFEDCQTRLSTGTATLDECLGLYPEHAEQLKPLLKTSRLLNSKQHLMPSPTFRAFGHFAIVRYAQSHPWQPRGATFSFSWRMAVTLAVLIVTLLDTGTAHAQSAMPGNTYYEWKRTSELAWRALSPNPVAVDVVLSERRLNEWIAVADDPVLGNTARKDYQKALSRLDPRENDESLDLIVSGLESQQHALKDAGLSISELDDYLAEVHAPGLIQITEKGPKTTDASAITIEAPSAVTDILATEAPIDIPVEIGPKNCFPNCGNNQGNASKGVGASQADEKSNNGKGDEKSNNGKGDEKSNNGKGDHENNGKGPK